ncbi:MAG: 3-oxoacyl-ACP synthase [Flavobacteriaceae bacterium]
MGKDGYIKSYCHIEENTVSLNGRSIYENKGVDFSSFIKSAYKHLDTNYPKFFKMDHLSKLAFLAADVLLNHEKIKPEKEENIALVLSNRASSLDTDRKHQETIQDQENYYPSPSVFVYTLPNICMGEISIKYKLYSENSFFIFDHFNPSYLYDYSNSLIADGKAEKVLCGWVDFDEKQYKAFLYLVAKKGAIAHNTEEIKRLF